MQISWLTVLFRLDLIQVHLIIRIKWTFFKYRNHTSFDSPLNEQQRQISFGNSSHPMWRVWHPFMALVAVWLSEAVFSAIW
jgi:hypothetical protein